MNCIDDYDDNLLLSDIPEDELKDFVKTTDIHRTQAILRLKSEITVKELKHILKFNKFQGMLKPKVEVIPPYKR